MANRWGNRDYIFGRLQKSLQMVTAAMKLKVARSINLDSILKSRDVTLPPNIHLVKSMFFSVVMYGYKTWTIKKAECQRIYAFEL